MRFSIITCSYNSLGGLKAAVDAVASSSSAVPAVKPTEIEHIVVDGGSTDGTVEWLENEHRTSNIEHPTLNEEPNSPIPQFPNPPINYSMKWISEPDKGLYDALNKGLRMATGDVIGILHSDDVWEEGVLKRVAEAFNRNTDIPVCEVLNVVDIQATGKNACATVSGVYGDLLYVDADDITKVKRVWKSGSYHSKKFYNGWMPPHPALFVTRALAERVGEYRLDLGSAADYEWMLRACLVHEANLIYINDVEENGQNQGMTPFVRMRVGGQSNASVQGRVDAHAADRRAWTVNGLQPKLWTLKMKVIRKLPQWVVAMLRMGE